MQAPFDQVGKNIFRELFIHFGTAEAAAEVPPTDALEIDFWYVPDPARAQIRDEMTQGILRAIADAPAMVELFSKTLGDHDFHGVLRKRYQWMHVLSARDDKPWPLIELWFISTGKPESVLDDYAFQPAPTGPSGHYVMLPRTWKVHIIVLRELPRTRDTLLLRAMSRGDVQRQAVRELIALPNGAWQKKLALAWLKRLFSMIPPEVIAQADEDERAMISQVQQEFDDWTRSIREEGERRGRDEGERRGRVMAVARLCERRLGRALSEGERAALVERFERLGEDRVDDALLTLDARALEAWLADPSAS